VSRDTRAAFEAYKAQRNADLKAEGVPTGSAFYPWKYARDCIVSADCFGYYSYIHNISSSNPRTWHISPSVCVIFYFFHQCHSFIHTGLLSP